MSCSTEVSIDSINNLRDLEFDLKLCKEQYENEIKEMKIKHTTEINEFKTKHTIEINELKRKINRLEREIETLKKEKDEFKKDIKELKVENKDLHNQIGELKVEKIRDKKNYDKKKILSDFYREENTRIEIILRGEEFKEYQNQ